MSEQLDPGWVRSGWGHGVRSLDDVLRAVSRIVSLAPNRSYVWRGCPSSRDRLRSSLLRHLVVAEDEPLPDETQVRRHEVAVLRAARAWGLAAEVGPLAPDLHLLAHLQQHGLPTRLIDVTHNPMTALWFACQGEDDHPGTLLAVDTTAMPAYDTLDPRRPPAVGLEADPLAWTLRAALRESALASRPFLVRPSAPTARTLAQEGLFLTGVVPAGPGPAGVDGLPLPPGPPPGKEALAVLFGEANRRAGRPGRLPFCALVVPARLKRTVRDHLGGLNRRRSVLHPDVAGFREAFVADHVALHPLPSVASAYEDDAADRPRG